MIISLNAINFNFNHLLWLGLLNQYLTKQMDEEEDEDKMQEEDSEEEDVTNTMLQNCLASIVEALSHNNPV